ncbi:diphthine synthase [Methanohalobium sp.]|uniref:diphthine synthase n=1 Tax=Methanohalobium sp. TaxID=2837493 RepID=UPI0025F74395|nr:diphthine synthase [Methanohalobium sp.]
MLNFIGLGLYDEKDISVKGLETIKNADKVYLEFYTSHLFGTDIKKMEQFYGKKIHVLKREDVEQHPDWIDEAKEKNIVFLTGGDSMVATTHVDLRIRAIDKGIWTSVIHGASIASAVCGLTGLQNYRFSKSTTIPFPYTTGRGKTIVSEVPYDTIKSNFEQGLHTLVYLDIDMDKGYMSINKGLEILQGIDKKRRKNFINDKIAVGVARAGSDNPVIKADYISSLIDFEFGSPLHILAIPGPLHFIEAEALVKLADGPEQILD